MKAIIATAVVLIAVILLGIDTLDRLSRFRPIADLTDPEYIQTLLLVAVALLMTRGESK